MLPSLIRHGLTWGLTWGLIWSPALLPAVAIADIYRCVGADGRTAYSDSPCPSGAAASANVTDAVQACASAECEARRERARVAAEARLREDKATVQQMQEHRLKAEALELERRVRLEELRRQTELALAQQQALSGIYAPAYPYSAYPLYPGYGRVGRWDGPGCKDLECGPVARPLPYPPRPVRYRGERATSFIDPPGRKK